MNHNIFTVGMALAMALLIMSGASILMAPKGGESDNQFQKRVEHQRYITGQFFLFWLFATLYFVWISLILPKPKGNKLF